MQSILVTFEDNGIRLDRFFKRHYANIPFTIIAKLIRKGKIKVNTKKADISTRLAENDKIFYPAFTDEELPVRDYEIPQRMIREVEEAILFKDENILVINKPAGLAVQGGSKIKVSLDDIAEHLKFGNEKKPKLVHRLDRDTSGIIIMARKVNIAAYLGELFKQKKIEKIYLAIVKGIPENMVGKIDIPLAKEVNEGFEKVGTSKNGKRAITYYQVMDHSGREFSLLALKLVTGRTHQIRAHLAMIGCPILFDEKYGAEDSIVNDIEPQMYLHAYEMNFDCYDRHYNIIAPFPKYFKDTLNRLGLNAKNIEYKFINK